MRTFEIGEETIEDMNKATKSGKEETARIKALIAKASTLDEIQRLEIQLQTGKLPNEGNDDNVREIHENIVEMDE